jgi:hypothetical protein
MSGAMSVTTAAISITIATGIAQIHLAEAPVG